MTDLGLFKEGFNSFRRTMAGAAIGNRMPVFINVVGEAAGYVTKGLDRVTAADELTDIATANGLNDADAVQFVIARVFGNIDDNVERVPDPQPSNGKGHNGKQQPQPGATPYVLPDPATIPPRQWLYAWHYIRGCVTATVAPGGFGKTTLALFEAMQMAAQGLRVWYVSGEDDRVEIDRRIAAHIAHNSTGPLQSGALFVDDKMTFPFKIATPVRGIPQFDDATLAQFEQAIARDKIDVVILDPFVSFHYLSENDTAAMDALIKRLSDTAFRQRCGIELSHHVRKPSNGQIEITVYDARGAGAIVNATRSCRVLNQMTTIEAEQCQIDPEFRSRHIRVDNGKRNMAPPEKAYWFQLVSQEIANGDKVQAMVSWEFNPKQLSENDTEWLKVTMRGKVFRADSRSPEWLGVPIAQRFDRDIALKGHIKWINAQIRKWLDAGVIAETSVVDKDHKARKSYVLAGDEQ